MNEVVRIQKNGDFDGVAIHQPMVFAIAYNGIDHSLWALSRQTGVLRRLRPDGRETLYVDGFKSPRAVLVDFRSGTAWVVQTGGRNLVEVDTSGATVREIAGFQAPWHAALDTKANVMWVADSTVLQIIPLDDPEQRKVVPGFRFLKRVTLDSVSHTCWGLDWAFEPDDSRVVKFSTEGKVLFAKSGFTDVRALAVNAFNGHCFVTETSSYTLTEIDPTGEVLSRLVLDGGLLDVAVQMLSE
jgi:DNA-binding beta-propeller fold protein YncE